MAEIGKQCSTSLTIKEMQISTLRFHLTLVRIAKIHNKRTAHTAENVELRKHSSIVGVTENCTVIMEISVAVSPK